VLVLVASMASCVGQKQMNHDLENMDLNVGQDIGLANTNMSEDSDILLDNCIASHVDAHCVPTRPWMEGDYLLGRQTSIQGAWRKL